MDVYTRRIAMFILPRNGEGPYKTLLVEKCRGDAIFDGILKELLKERKASF